MVYNMSYSNVFQLRSALVGGGGGLPFTKETVIHVHGQIASSYELGHEIFARVLISVNQYFFCCCSKCTVSRQTTELRSYNRFLFQNSFLTPDLSEAENRKGETSHCNTSWLHENSPSLFRGIFRRPITNRMLYSAASRQIRALSDVGWKQQ